MGKIIGVFLLLIIGGFMALFTDMMVRFQVWSQHTIMGAQYIPSKRTHTAVRITGVLLVIVSIIVFVFANK